MDELQGLIFPLSGITTSLELPYTVYDSSDFRITLRALPRSEIEQYFRVRIVEDETTGVYHGEMSEDIAFWGDDDIIHSLHSTKLQICIEPKGGVITEAIRDRMSLALECALGYFDEYVAWRYPSFSTVASRGMYRSHYSARRSGDMDVSASEIIRKVFASANNVELEHKFNTLRALLNSARHQARASDVACVLYFSILESIYVQSKTELTYKLAMRMTKKLGHNYQFASKIIHLYDKRGNVIHGTDKGNVFEDDEFLLLEGLAKDSLIDYISNPNDYSNRKLDKLLLN